MLSALVGMWQTFHSIVAAIRGTQKYLLMSNDKTKLHKWKLDTKSLWYIFVEWRNLFNIHLSETNNAFVFNSMCWQSPAMCSLVSERIDPQRWDNVCKPITSTKRQQRIASVSSLSMAHWAQGNLVSSFYFSQVYLDVLLPRTDIAQGQKKNAR